MKPAKFRVTTTDELGNEVVIVEGLVQSYSMSTRPVFRYNLDCMSVVEYIPQPMEFELKGLIYPAEEEPEDEKRPMTVSSLDDPPKPEPLHDRWSEYDDDY